MKTIKVTVSIFILLFICSNIYAAPAGNTSDSKIPYGDGVLKLKNTIGSVKLSIDAESIIDRDLESSGTVTDGGLEGEWYLLRVGYPLFEEVLEPYVKIGVSHLEASWKQNGTFTLIKGDNDLAWGIGAKFLAYEIPKNRVKFTIDGQYRFTEPNIDDVTINDPSRTVSASEYSIGEWQISGIVSLEIPFGQKSRFDKSDIYSLVPYVGLGYSDCKVTGKFTYGASEYNIKEPGSDKKVVLITGCDFLTPQNVSVNVESRLIGETSVSAGGTVKF